MVDSKKLRYVTSRLVFYVHVGRFWIENEFVYVFVHTKRELIHTSIDCRSQFIRNEEARPCVRFCARTFLNRFYKRLG